MSVPEVAAEVGLLTRLIRIEGPVSTTGIGGHMIVSHSSTPQHVDGVELVRMGQQGAKGRYPIHLHMNRETPQTVVRRYARRPAEPKPAVPHAPCSGLAV